MILALGAVVVLAGCGGGGDSTKANSTLAVTYGVGVGQTDTISFTGNTWQAIKTANTLTATTPLENGDRVTITTPNPSTVPAIYSSGQVTVNVIIDGTTYTPASGFTVTVTNAAGTFAGTFTGPLVSGGNTIEVTSGTFLIQY